MNKHRKTLKEKKLADLRHKFLEVKKEHSFLTDYHLVPNVNIPKQTLSISVYTHRYLKQDLLKTVFLTISLIAIQLIMFFMLKSF